MLPFLDAGEKDRVLAAAKRPDARQQVGGGLAELLQAGGGVVLGRLAQVIEKNLLPLIAALLVLDLGDALDVLRLAAQRLPEVRRGGREFGGQGSQCHADRVIGHADVPVAPRAQRLHVVDDVVDPLDRPVLAGDEQRDRPAVHADDVRHAVQAHVARARSAERARFAELGQRGARLAQIAVLARPIAARDHLAVAQQRAELLPVLLRVDRLDAVAEAVQVRRIVEDGQRPSQPRRTARLDHGEGLAVDDLAEPRGGERPLVALEHSRSSSLASNGGGVPARPHE